MKLVLAIILAAVMASAWLVIPHTLKAYGHDWYPPHCCSDADCAPLESGRVEPLLGGGFLIDGTFYIQREKVGASMDGRYHACFPTKNNLRCFFAPPRGM